MGDFRSHKIQTGSNPGKEDIFFSTVIVHAKLEYALKLDEERHKGQKKGRAQDVMGYLCAGKFVRRLRLSLDRVDRVGPVAGG